MTGWRSGRDVAWAVAVPRPMMSWGSVHVWRARLSDPRLMSRCREYLSSEEMERANACQDIRHKHRFMACRTCLRDILSRYLPDTTPSEVRLGKHAMGKPTLIDTEQRLFFNVAHTGDMGLIAVSNAAEVGVDIEQKGRKIRNLRSLIPRRFTERESLQLIASSSNRAGTTEADTLRINFLNLWTQKEAFVKCTGEGIARGLKTFEVDVDEDRPRIYSVDGILQGNDKWSLHKIIVDENHVASLATAIGNQASVHCLDWNAASCPKVPVVAPEGD